MTKLFILLFLLIPLFINAQSDTSTFRSLNKTFGEAPHKNVTWTESQKVLLIIGDSIFHFIDSNKLEQKVRENMAGRSMNIITNPDSIQRFLKNRVKGIIYLKKE